MPFGIGSTELLIIGILAVILFGNRLPSVARSLGKSLTEFKKGMREFENEMHSSVYSEPAGRVSYHEQIGQSTPPVADKPAAEQPAAPADQPASEPQHQ